MLQSSSDTGVPAITKGEPANHRECYHLATPVEKYPFSTPGCSVSQGRLAYDEEWDGNCRITVRYRGGMQ